MLKSYDIAFRKRLCLVYISCTALPCWSLLKNKTLKMSWSLMATWTWLHYQELPGGSRQHCLSSHCYKWNETLSRGLTGVCSETRSGDSLCTGTQPLSSSTLVTALEREKQDLILEELFSRVLEKYYMRYLIIWVAKRSVKLWRDWANQRDKPGGVWAGNRGWSGRKHDLKA